MLVARSTWMARHGGERLESGGGKNHGGPGSDRGQGAGDAAEAVIHRHGDAHAIGFGDAEPVGDRSRRCSGGCDA